MEEEAGIISPESSPSHHFIQFTGDAFPDNLKYSLLCFHSSLTVCVFLHIYLCVCVASLTGDPGDRVLICPLLSSYLLKECWHVGDIY